MSSLPASQPAEDGEAVGTPVPSADDPLSAEPPVTDGGARKSVAPAPDGLEANGHLSLANGINLRSHSITTRGTFNRSAASASASASKIDRRKRA